MAALLAGNTRCVSTRIRELEARARGSLRRGLVLSVTLHIALVVLFLRLTQGGGESLAPSYRTPAIILRSPTIPLSYSPNVAPSPAREKSNEGPITPVRDFDRLKTALPEIRPLITGAGDPRRGETDPEPGDRGSSPGVSGPPDPQVYRVEDVDEVPVPIDAPHPIYPEWAQQTGATGRVVLRLLVGADGRVVNVRVIEGDRTFSDAARDALLRWRFKPAKFQGRAVPVWVEVPVEFRM